jgi:putative PIN family toxin of toxin-antitoxin system
VKIVLDASVVAAAVGWNGEAFLCFVRLARRYCFAFGTEETLCETKETCLRLIREKKFTHNAPGRLSWYLEKVQIVPPSPLGKRRSRDPKDDPYLSAALSAQAEIIVTYDKDLLILQRPFGIRILRPAMFLKSIGS